ncbi:MAG: hypothetical protein HOV97_05425 [Nonomuraea sp.]|nr:hypothetical protein [Nonomuraea sp.]
MSLPVTVSGPSSVRLRRSCRWCALVFVGSGAIQRWADHTWSHWDELVESQLLLGVDIVKGPEPASS